MRRIHARWIVSAWAVVEDAKRLVEWSVREFVGNAMGEDNLLSVFLTADILPDDDYSVSPLVLAALPEHTAVFFYGTNKATKAIRESAGFVGAVAKEALARAINTQPLLYLLGLYEEFFRAESADADDFTRMTWHVELQDRSA